MKKKHIVMLAVLLVALAAAIYSLTQTDWELPSAPAQTADFATAATEHALSTESISENEILIVQATKTDDSGTHVTFCIFSVAQGCTPKDYLSLDMDTARSTPELTQVGTATASFLGGKPENIRNLKISHTS